MPCAARRSIRGCIFAWPQARCAVMGGEQATSTLLDITVKSLQRQGQQPSMPTNWPQLRDKVRRDYDRQMDVRYGAARGWVDAILDPAQTRSALVLALELATRHAELEPLRWGVFQV